MVKRKIAYSVIALLLLSAVVVLCVLRWQVWFGNPPEEVYKVSTMPHNVVLTLGEDATTSRTISWRADTVLHSSYVLLQHGNYIDTIEAHGTIVESRMGKAAFYNAALVELKPDTYQISAVTGKERSKEYVFVVREPSEHLRFAVLGDVQDRMGEYSQSLFASLRENNPNLDFIVQVGDLIERPTDAYWQIFFSAFENDTLVPFEAATGNHEYLKGVIKHLDSRWTSVFVNPKNGAKRALARSYFVDYPQLRLIVLDTDQLFLLSDYTQQNAWLRQAIQEAEGKRVVVVMHHAIYSAAMGRNNMLMHAFFANTLRGADLVFAGHDHSYARRTVKHLDNSADYVHYVVTTSEKAYLSKVSKRDERICTDAPVYCIVESDADELTVSTYLVSDNSLYDCVKLVGDSVVDHYKAAEELLGLPERYQDRQQTRKVRKFLERTEERAKGL